jgi:putative PIN family toxin of toxin-antitoxin system
MKYKIAIDTNVIIAALRSKRGASYRLLTRIDSEKFSFHISVPFILEYEDVAKRLLETISLSEQDIDDILDYICKIGIKKHIFYLWRPFLKDPKDDMILELAVSSECNLIVVYNKNHFQGVEQFGIEVLTAKEFLEEIGELP